MKRRLGICVLLLLLVSAGCGGSKNDVRNENTSLPSTSVQGESVLLQKLKVGAKYIKVSEPSRNFNILNSIVILDPRDGKEKYVLSNFASGATGNLIFIDPDTGEGEAIQLPGDEGAWALLNLNNEKLLVGTCSRYGYLLSLDLKSRKWAEPLSIPSEKYIWNLALGSDGMVYGGTYPGNVLLRYDPLNHKLENLGRVTSNSKDMYSRNVYGSVPGHIIVTGGFDRPYIAAWSFEKKAFITIDTFDSSKTLTFRYADEEFIAVTVGSEYKFYDSKTFEVLNKPELKFSIKAAPGNVFSDGRAAAVRGQDYYIKKPSEKTEYRRIPTTPPVTGIHTITSDKNGKIWGSCGFGQTIFSYDPGGGAVWNSSTVSNNGGEVYGMVFHGERLFMTSYSGGDHIVYNPDIPWNQTENQNPRTFASVSFQKLIRPLGRSVLGPDNFIWTGWSASYGTYGGGLTSIDTDSLSIKVFYDPIPQQQINSVSADSRYVYFTTDGGGNGLTTRSIPGHFGVWAPEGKLIFSQTFENGTGPVFASGNKVALISGNSLHIFDPEAMKFIKQVDIGKRCTCIISADNDNLLLFSQGSLILFNLKDYQYKQVAYIPSGVQTAVKTPDDDIYFAVNTVLYKLIYEN